MTTLIGSNAADGSAANANERSPLFEFHKGGAKYDALEKMTTTSLSDYDDDCDGETGEKRVVGMNDVTVSMACAGRRRWRMLTLSLPAVALLALAMHYVISSSTEPCAGTRARSPFSSLSSSSGITRVAFIGNSMFYFNDFPRYFQAFAVDGSRGKHVIEQNSCLHGGGSIPSLLLEGNAMYPQFRTPNATLPAEYQVDPDDILYDYGACTVPQLLMGTDDRLDDPGYARSPIDNITNPMGNQNPCRMDPSYLHFSKEYFNYNGYGSNPRRYWDYVLINDNTRNPARRETRAKSLQFLEAFYVPWFIETGATPVFLWTHAYSINSTQAVNMTGLESVAEFTSLTGAGYRAYQDLLADFLPLSQSPRIAPVGLAFLLVHEDDPGVWRQLFHAADMLHASPSGTFLQGCIMYYTLFESMPRLPWLFSKHRQDPATATERAQEQHLLSLWDDARMMQHAYDPPNPFPTLEMARYLYDVAERIMVDGEVPKTYVHYTSGEAATVYDTHVRNLKH